MRAGLAAHYIGNLAFVLAFNCTRIRGHRQSWATRAQARRAVFDYIEVFYNRKRLHSSLGYVTPAAYETSITNHTAAHAA